jgi:hypothetical protein
MTEPAKKKRSLLFRILRVAVVLVLVLLMAFFGVGYLVLNGKYEVVRQLTIKAPPQGIHQQVGDLREWPNWLPFTKHDKSVKVTIDKPSGVGAQQSWTSDGNNGRLSFAASDEEKGVEYDMVFDEKYTSKGIISYAKSGDDPLVTWKMTGQMDDLIGRWFALLMPSMMGPMFDEGLADLKTKVETK